jgi:1-acyl-sn-glycerol-3-phosphate acyltransferase
VLYALAEILVRAVLRLFLRVQVEGRENIPEGGAMVVSNHLSWTDTAFVLYAFPRGTRLWTMANETTVFNTGWKRWLMPRLCVFPIRRNRGMLDEAAVEHVYSLLNSGEKVLMFPEGAYGKDGELKPLKDGVGYFALNSQKPILPVSLSGTNRLRPWGRVHVVIGQPFIPDPPAVWEVKRRVARWWPGCRRLCGDSAGDRVRGARGSFGAGGRSGGGALSGPG